MVQRKLTITIDERLYKKLYQRIGQGRISRFIAESIAPLLKAKDPLHDGYKKMATDEKAREEAHDWIESSVDECLPDDALEDWDGWK